jgi:hypothetical protein
MIPESLTNCVEICLGFRELLAQSRKWGDCIRLPKQTPSMEAHFPKRNHSQAKIKSFKYKAYFGNLVTILCVQY